jgi:hypothetical protein
MREGLTPGVLDIQPHELVSRLLQATGQDTPGAVDPAALLAFLKLDFLPVDFKSSLAPVLPLRNGKVRALLSFPDRLVAVDMGLDERRIRFSALHEVGHYVLPAHQHALYLCDAEGRPIAGSHSAAVQRIPLGRDPVLRKALEDRLEAAGISEEWANVLADLDRLSSFQVPMEKLAELPAQLEAINKGCEEYQKNVRVITRRFSST